MSRLFLIRHAHADAQGISYPDDSKRPLTDKGLRQAKNLAKLLEKQDIQLDYLFSSPYTRAAQTAEPLTQRLAKGRYIQYIDTLTQASYAQLLAELKEWLGSSDTNLALVGHEPYLSELASILLSKRSTGISIHFKKAGMLILHGSIEPGEMTLDAYLPHSWYKHFLA